MTEITDLPRFIEIHIQKGAMAPEGEGHFRSILFMILSKFLERKVTHHISIIAKDGFILGEEIFYIF